MVDILILTATRAPLRFVTYFWPRKVKHGKVQEIHAKMVRFQQSAPSGSGSGGGEPGSSSKKRPSFSGGGSRDKMNGSSSNGGKSNGKSHHR